MTELNKLYFIRHAEAPEDNLDEQGRRRILPEARIAAQALGRRLTNGKAVGRKLDLSVIGVTEDIRTIETAVALSSHLATPRLIRVPCFSELLMVKNGEISRDDLIKRVERRQPPQEMIARGIEIVAALPEIDE